MSEQIKSFLSDQAILELRQIRESIPHFEQVLHLKKQIRKLDKKTDEEIRLFCVEQAAKINSADRIGFLPGEPDRTINFLYDFITNKEK